MAAYARGQSDASAANIEHDYKITPKMVCVLVRREHGLMTNVAKALKVPYTTMLRYAKQRPEVQDAVTTAREAMGDVAEKKLFELIRAGDVRCLLYYLSTVHRGRGYGLRPGEGPFDPDGAGKRSMHVDTINIISVPSGKFLSEPKQPVVIEQ